MSASITIDIGAGTSIDRACEDACRVADRLEIDVRFDFNSVRCLARPGGSPADLAERWDNELSRKLYSPGESRFAKTDAASAGEYLRRLSTPSTSGEGKR